MEQWELITTDKPEDREPFVGMFGLETCFCVDCGLNFDVCDCDQEAVENEIERQQTDVRRPMSI